MRPDPALPEMNSTACLFATLGMVLVAGALNWIIFFLGLGLALYVLTAVRKGEAASSEPA